MLTKSQWRDGRRGQDSWGRYTRRRKWMRDAELIETTPSTEPTPIPIPTSSSSAHGRDASVDTEPPPPYSPTAAVEDTASETSPRIRRRRWFSRASRPGSEHSVQPSSGGSASTAGEMTRDEPEQDVYTPLSHHERESEWGVGEELKLGLG